MIKKFNICGSEIDFECPSNNLMHACIGNACIYVVPNLYDSPDLATGNYDPDSSVIELSAHGFRVGRSIVHKPFCDITQEDISNAVRRMVGSDKIDHCIEKSENMIAALKFFRSLR